MEIWHLALRADWEAARADGAYRASTRGRGLKDVGFIHASTPDQLAAVAEFGYSGEKAELCVLVMDDDAIRAAGTLVRHEDGGNGELYPHIYGEIDPAWVVEVLPAGFESDRFAVGASARVRADGPSLDTTDGLRG